MTILRFLGGVGKIGGNICLIESQGTRVLFDFGLDLNKQNTYFSQFLRPRRAHALRDFQMLGLLPHLEGLYREDYLHHLGDSPCQEPSVDAIFLSHGHIDHIGNIHFVRHDIPIYCSPKTGQIMQARQVTTSRGFNEFCTLKKAFYLRKKKRGDGFTRASSRYAEDLVKYDRNIHDLVSEKPVQVGSVSVMPFLVDHSLPGAMGFLIQTPRSRIVYTGDFRIRGYHRSAVNQFVEAAREFDPDIFITEGTNIEEKTGPSEFETRQSLENEIRATDGFCMINFPIFDFDRLKSVFEATIRAERKLVIRMKQAYLLNLLEKANLLDFEDLTLKNDDIVVYKQKKSWGSPFHLLRHPTEGWKPLQAMNIATQDRKKLRCWDYRSWEEPFIEHPDCIEPDTLRKNQQQYVFYCNYYQLTDLLDISPMRQSTYIWSKTEPFNPDIEVNFERLKNWLSRFNLDSNVQKKVKGKVKNRIHASGHIYRSELRDLLHRIDPNTVFPIHTAHPELFQQYVRSHVELPIAKKRYDV